MPRIEPDMQKSALKVMVVMGGVEYASYTEDGIKGKVSEAGGTDDLDEIFG